MNTDRSRWTLAPLTLALFVATSAHAGQDIDDRIQASQSAIQSFAAALQGEMMAGMEAGGPVGAIDVCRERAPEIAAEISAETGWEVGRTSLKLRNPDNAPDEWERAILEDFDSRRAEGTPAAELHHHEIVEDGDEKTFRFMRAIPTAGLCLTCHGEVGGDIQHALERLYPEDQATGYSEGDVRGAFTIIQRM
ncbi:Tll0287-like domain-containing protein [Thioalkalivibrio paradoxus]|uniref:Glutamate synthase n=1 Tax=Thioalkalivibrio paradoxus ARh 1 TaxID=713585 RepID=W0DGD9_9GAMM|nr:glutamate synthase [Thioalkalivibrio paradoxus ARh 1]